MNVTRRNLMQNAVLGASIVGAARCAVVDRSERGRMLPDTPSPPTSSSVAVVRPSKFPSLKEALHAVVALAGGLGFIQPGQRVLLKPNLNSGNAYPATAAPETLLVLADLVREAGGDPFIADRTMFAGATQDAFKKTGMLDAAAEAKMEAIALETTPVVLVHHPLAENWFAQTIPIYQTVFEADHVINFCTPRTHSVGDFTMALKNNVGVVEGRSRALMHAGPGFKERVAEIMLVARPSLVVMDGRDGFTNGGPDTGDLAHMDFLAVGQDPVAVDAVGLAHLRLAGTNDAVGLGSIWDIPLLRRAVEVGAGVGNADSILIHGLEADDVARLKSHMA